MTTLYGSNFEGGHFSRGGNAPDRTSVPVPLYRHEVSLDYARVELGLNYTIAPGWDVIGRVPWELKDQHASIGFVDPATPSQREAMQHNVDIHHRSTTLRGIGDLMVLGRRGRSNVWRDGDTFTLSAGATIPTGKTVENPYRLGQQGIQHLHIQFGTGTVDPLLETSYRAPIAGRFSAGAYLAGRFPFYENKRTVRAPPDATLGVHVAHQTTNRLQFRLESALFVQGYGYWDAMRDENTGLMGTSITGGVTFQLHRVSVNADLRHPISQTTLTEGDAFTQGPTFLLSIGGRLR